MKISPTIVLFFILGCAPQRAVLAPPRAAIDKSAQVNSPRVEFHGDPSVGLFIRGYHPVEDKSVLYCIDYATWKRSLEEEAKRGAVPMVAR